MMFSVVIPLYNKERTIERAIRSVLTQTAQDFEIVVVNDGSTDGGPRIVSQIPDARIRLIHQANGGVSAARNRGIAAARHEYIAFLDADDEWLPGFLSTCQTLVRKFPGAGVYATRYYVGHPEGTLVPAYIRGLPETFEGELADYFLVAACSEPPICSSAVCLRKDVLRRIGGFPDGVRLGEDLLTWAKAAWSSSVAYSMVPLSICHITKAEDYRQTPTRIPDAVDRVGRELRALLEVKDSPSLRAYLALWHKMRASQFLRLGMARLARQEVVAACRFGWRWKLLVYYGLSVCPPRVILGAFRLGGHASKSVSRRSGYPCTY